MLTVQRSGVGRDRANCSRAVDDRGWIVRTAATALPTHVHLALELLARHDLALSDVATVVGTDQRPASMERLRGEVEEASRRLGDALATFLAADSCPTAARQVRRWDGDPARLLAAGDTDHIDLCTICSSVRSRTDALHELATAPAAAPPLGLRHQVLRSIRSIPPDP